MDPSFSGFTPGFQSVLEFSLKQAVGLPLSMLQPSSKPGVQRPQQALCHPARRSWAILQRLLSKPFYPIPPPAALLKNWGRKEPGPRERVLQEEIPLQDVPTGIPEREELRCRVERGGSASLAVVHLPDPSCLQENLCAAKGDVIPTSLLLKSSSLPDVAQGWCY